jgi:arginase
VRQLETVEAAGIAAVMGSKEGSAPYAERFSAAVGALPFQAAMIHLEVDCLDTSVGLANEYAAPGGLSVPDLHGCLRSACAAVKPLSLTIASFNPNLDGADRISAAAIAGAVIVASAACA